MTESNDILNVAEADFEKEVIEHSKTRPVLVDFWAKWCGPCVKLKPLLESAATKGEGAFRLVKVDTDANQNIAMAFGISSIPAVMMFRDGKPVDSFVGLVSPTELDAFINRWLPQPADKLVDEAIEAIAKGNWPEARQACEKALELNPNHDFARINLAKALLEEKGKEANADAIEALIEPLPDSGPLGEDVLRIKGRLYFLRLAQGGTLGKVKETQAAELCAKAGEKALKGETEQAVEDLLAAGELDFALAKGAVKEALIQCFHLLGEHHPKLAGYRSRLMMLLT